MGFYQGFFKRYMFEEKDFKKISDWREGDKFLDFLDPALDAALDNLISKNDFTPEMLKESELIIGDDHVVVYHDGEEYLEYMG